MRKKNYLLSFLLLLLSSFFTIDKANAQLENLTNLLKDTQLEGGKYLLSGVAGLNFNQTSLVNWSAGGDNVIGGNLYLKASLKKKTESWLWVSDLDLDYGISKIKGVDSRKASDKIDLSSQIGYDFAKSWYAVALGSFQTQFDKGYNYQGNNRSESYISRFMSPAYVNLSLGIDFRPNAIYSIYFSPVMSKITIVNDNFLSHIGAFGVEKGKNVKYEIGAYIKAKLEKDVMENVKLISTLDLFSAYNNKFGNIDIDWDVLISMKINKFLSATINTTLKYDDDIKSEVDKDGKVLKGPKVQFKEVLGIGLAYNF